MTTTSVDDAIILPQSQGTGLNGEDAVIDAAINGVLNRYVGGEYVSSAYSTGLAFQNHDGTNDTVEVGSGIVFIKDNSTSTSGERGSGGNPQAESSTTSGYDTELPEGHTYAVLLPTPTEITVSNSTLNKVFVDIDDVTANNSVNLEHDGSTTASPGTTSLKIGETNPDDASADTRANDDASPIYSGLTVNGTTTTDTLNADQADITNFSAVLEKNSDDVFSADTDTTVDWDNQDVDTNIFSYDSSTDELEVLTAGDYRIEAQYKMNDAAGTNLSSGDKIFVRLYKNGSLERSAENIVNDTEGMVRMAVLSKDLATNDTIRLDMRAQSQALLNGTIFNTWATISKEA